MFVDDDNAGGVCIYFSSYGQSCYKDNKTKLNGTVHWWVLGVLTL